VHGDCSGDGGRVVGAVENLHDVVRGAEKAMAARAVASAAQQVAERE
jgi:hypothetical protein